MDRVVKLTIAFDGTRYKGWQRQTGAITIQGVIEDKLAALCRQRVELHGAGRTDAGVHATGMVAHFHTSVKHDLTAFYKGLNSMLPEDIRIMEAQEAEPGFHSRFSATGKTYNYYFSNDSSPLFPHKRLYTSHFPFVRDFVSIQECLAFLHGEHDLASFEAAGSRSLAVREEKGAVRTIYLADCQPVSGQCNTWCFTFCGSGFLRYMVRNLVGTLCLVGQKKISVADFIKIVKAKDRCQAGPTAPPQGLFLTKVHYSEAELP